MAVDLRDECGRRGVHLLAGEADRIVSDHIAAVAQTLGVTTRTVLDRYVLENFIPTLADQVAATGSEYKGAVDTVEPVVLGVAETGRVLAALGMTLKLAVDALQDTHDSDDALSVATDTADAVVGIGAAIHNHDPAHPVEIGGRALVYTRRVINKGVELIRDGSWRCPCRDSHMPGVACRTVRQLEGDLNLVGGWPDRADEPPADQR